MSRSLMLCATLGVVAAAGAGCYSGAPSIPTTPTLPPIVEGGQLEIETSRHRFWSDDLLRWLSYTSVDKMTYDGKPLTYNQVRNLADPEWKKKLADYDDVASSCRHASIPRYIGYAAIVLGLVTFTGAGGAVFQDNGDLQQAVAFGFLGTGLLSYGTGYYLLGGKKCEVAEKMADQLYFGAAERTTFIDSSAPGLRREVEEVANAFNRRALATKTEEPATDETLAADDTPAPDAPREKPRKPAKPVPTPEPETAPPPITVVPSAVLDAVAATGKFPTFLKVIDNAHQRELFKDGETYTLLIPTEETFAKLHPAKLNRLTTGKLTAMDEVIWKQHVVVGIRTEKQMVKGVYLDPIGGRHRVEKRKNGEVVVGGATIGPAIKLPNAVIYPIDKLF